MPSLGDFFRVDLPSSFVDPWDAWLQRGLRSAKAELNDQWNDCFMSAPIWRFTLAKGLVGPSAMMGVLMPSVDRVGRQFPLTLAMPIAQVDDVPLAHFGAEDVFENLEGVALGALEDGITRDMLKGRLVQVPKGHPVGAGREVANGRSVSVVGQDPVARLASASVRGRSIGSVWSAALDADSPLLMVDGLPMGGEILGLFDLNAPIWTARLEGVQ